MRRDTEKTKVIFRKFKREILALFPELLGTNSPYTCSCYAHLGQHGSCEPTGVIFESKPAKPSEYRDLAAELRSLGYNLDIIKRNSPNFLDVRREELKHSVTNLGRRWKR